MRILLVSSFVLPHAGGVEQFVDTISQMLTANGAQIRLLACRRPGEDSSADVLVRTRFLGASGWPLPVGDFRTLWREVAAADAVIANNSLHVLPALSVLAARRQGIPALFVIHGSGEPLPLGSTTFRLVRRTFQRTVGRQAIRSSLPVSVSNVGVDGVRALYGVRAHHLPYPLPPLPPAEPVLAPARDEPMRVAWIGRLSPEKDPELAVTAVEQLRTERAAVLDMFGDGRLRGRLEALASSRPWLTLHGSRPWEEILAAQERAHAVLATSVWDNAQVALLEALARGVPAVSTRVGEAPHYLMDHELARFCVPRNDPRALARALAELAGSYDGWRRRFTANGQRLRAIHESAPDILRELISVARAARR